MICAKRANQVEEMKGKRQMARVASFILFSVSILFATNESLLEKIKAILEPTCDPFLPP